MAKVATDAMIDGGLDKIITANEMNVCAGQPVSFADIAVKSLAVVALIGGDFTKANGDVSGRKVTIGQKSSISIVTTGTADHVAIDDSVSEYYVTTCTPQALTSGGTVTVPAWDIEISDPA